MIEIKAPNPVPIFDGRPHIFLAGSIEMGAAEDWQTRFAKAFEDEDVVLLNPRRDDWDSSWVQDISNPQFKQQVDWELDNITHADYVVFYFDPATKSPITLMELGHSGTDPVNVVVCCPRGFWRKGNVDIYCARQGIPVVETLEEMIALVKGG